MKKTSILLLTFLLTLLLCSSACAAGLSGLGGSDNAGELDNLNQRGKPGLLPDPIIAMENPADIGTLLQADYAFSDDYLCDAYVYPRQTSRFYSSYSSVLRAFGYTMTETTVDGLEGYSISWGDGKEALLVKDFDGQMLFLVEKGMDFVLTNVASCVYNGDDYTMYLHFSDTPDEYPHDRWGATYKLDDGSFELWSIDIPKSARTGKIYEIADESDCFDGLQMEYKANYKYKTLLYDSVSLYRTDGIRNSRDYAIITVTRMEDTPRGKLIVGTFEGSFYKSDDVFENGTFSAIIDD